MNNTIQQNLYNSLCPTNRVWVNKTGYGNLDIMRVGANCPDKNKINLEKDSYYFNLLNRLGNKVSNSGNRDTSWRPL